MNGVLGFTENGRRGLGLYFSGFFFFFLFFFFFCCNIEGEFEGDAENKKEEEDRWA